MKVIGIGLIILLIAFVLSMYSAYINYKWIPKVISGGALTPEERQVWNNDMTTIALAGLIANILAIVGVLIFLIEFIKHAHPHEHEHAAPKALPPPL